MRQKRSKYNGVSYEPDRVLPWRAWIRIHGILVRLGDFATPTEAVLAADLARYVAWGIDARKWQCDERRNAGEPNKAPSTNLPFDPQRILDALGNRREDGSRLVDGMTIVNNWDAYLKMADEVAKLGGW
jgi:hypothetical protein